MKIFDKEIKLAIFDMDGTLIDSTGIWSRIDLDFFNKRGYDKVPDDYAEQIVHMGLEKGAVMTVEKYGKPGDTPESVKKEWKEASYQEYLYRIPLKPYAREAIEYFKKNSVIVALATANDKKLYVPCLKRLGLDNIFDFIVDVDTVKEGKSSPKIYNVIADEFGISHDETIVFEDTLIAIRTASLEGYVTVGVDDNASRCALKEKQEMSYKYIYSLKEIIK